MTENQSDLSTYHWALRESASLRDHRLNSERKAQWWSAVHTMLAKHTTTDEGTCAVCVKPWPCGAVQGAVQDLQTGSLGY